MQELDVLWPVGNIPDVVKLHDLISMFERCGNVTEIQLLKNFGFITMRNETEATRAVTELNNIKFMDKELKVQVGLYSRVY